MSRKDYIAIAQAVKHSIPDGSAKDLLVHQLCVIFAEDNPLFDRDRFTKACENG